MGGFAVSAAASYQVGVARGDRSILSAMDISPEEFFANLGRSINDLILCHRADLERKRQTTRPASEPKMRWTDGTPEYSFYICALRKLFPEALFVHVLRDVHDVVRSMLNFHRVAGFPIIGNENEAYKYWLRAVKACAQAERAYGPRVVHRICYAALVENPTPVMRSLLEFAGEAYCARCLEPLNTRINSSNVPTDFRIDDAAIDPAVVQEATQLSRDLETTVQPAEASRAAADEMEAAFSQRTQYMATLESQYLRVLQSTRNVEKTKTPLAPV